MRLLALLLAATQTLPTMTVQGPDRFEGRWKPDQQANSILARSELAKRGGPASDGARPPHGGRHHEGGMGGGGGMGDMGGGGGAGGGGGGGGPPGGAPPSGGGPGLGGPKPDQLESPESRVVVPPIDDLLIAGSPAFVIFASGPSGLLQLPADGKPLTLVDGTTRARLQHIDDDLVITLDHPDERHETLTYHLEGDGRRLRITSTLEAPGLGVPLSRQRLYNRVEEP
jgi:hypothetical protein